MYTPNWKRNGSFNNSVYKSASSYYSDSSSSKAKKNKEKHRNTSDESFSQLITPSKEFKLKNGFEESTPKDNLLETSRKRLFSTTSFEDLLSGKCSTMVESNKNCRDDLFSEYGEEVLSDVSQGVKNMKDTIHEIQEEIFSTCILKKLKKERQRRESEKSSTDETIIDINDIHGIQSYKEKNKLIKKIHGKLAGGMKPKNHYLQQYNEEKNQINKESKSKPDDNRIEKSKSGFQDLQSDSEGTNLTNDSNNSIKKKKKHKDRERCRDLTLIENSTPVKNIGNQESKSSFQDLQIDSQETNLTNDSNNSIKKKKKHKERDRSADLTLLENFTPIKKKKKKHILDDKGGTESEMKEEIFSDMSFQDFRSPKWSTSPNFQVPLENKDDSDKRKHKKIKRKLIENEDGNSVKLESENLETSIENGEGLNLNQPKKKSKKKQKMQSNEETDISSLEGTPHKHTKKNGELGGNVQSLEIERRNCDNNFNHSSISVKKKKKHSEEEDFIVTEDSTPVKTKKKKHKVHETLTSPKLEFDCEHQDDSDYRRKRKKVRKKLGENGEIFECDNLNDSLNLNELNKDDPDYKRKRKKVKKNLEEHEGASPEVLESQTVEPPTEDYENESSKKKKKKHKENSKLTEEISPNRIKRKNSEDCSDSDSDFTQHYRDKTKNMSMDLSRRYKREVQNIFLEPSEDDGKKMHIQKLKAIADGDVTLKEEEKYRYSSLLEEVTMKEEDEYFESKRILKHLSIMLPFEIPPSHLIETRMSSVPTADQNLQFEALDIEMKNGPYSPEEDNIIKRNWKRFCKLHDLDHNKPEIFLNFSFNGNNTFRKSERINFVRFLGHNLPHRKLYSIYKRFQNIYNPAMKKGRFEPEEDRLILTIANDPNKSAFSELAKILKRPRHCIEKRHRRLKLNFNYPQLMEERHCLIKDKEYVIKFLETFMRVKGVEDVNELKTIKLSKEDFRKLAKKLQEPYRRVKDFWHLQLYSRLFVPKEWTTIDIKLKLIEKMYRTEEDYNWKTINWREVAKAVDGLSWRHAYRLVYNLVKNYAPRTASDLKDSIHVLNDAYIGDKYLYDLNHISFKNGVLKISPRGS